MYSRYEPSTPVTIAMIAMFKSLSGSSPAFLALKYENRIATMNASDIISP